MIVTAKLDGDFAGSFEAEEHADRVPWPKGLTQAVQGKVWSTGFHREGAVGRNGETLGRRSECRGRDRIALQHPYSFDVGRPGGDQTGCHHAGIPNNKESSAFASFRRHGLRPAAADDDRPALSILRSSRAGGDCLPGDGDCQCQPAASRFALVLQSNISHNQDFRRV